MISDSNTVTVTCLITEADPLMQSLAQNGLIVKHISLEGRFHSPALRSSLSKVIELCRANGDIEFPSADKLRVPLRSNTDAQLIRNGSLCQIVSKSILTEVADWHLTLSSACYQSGLVGKSTFSALSIGLVDSFPHSLALELEMKVIRIRDAALFVDNSSRLNPKEPERPENIMSGVQAGPYSNNAIAVVVMACRSPGADTRTSSGSS